MLSLTSKTTHVPVRRKPVRPSYQKNQLVLAVSKMFTLDLGQGVRVRVPIETRKIRVARARAGAMLRRATLGGYMTADEFADEEHVMNVEDCGRY